MGRGYKLVIIHLQSGIQPEGPEIESQGWRMIWCQMGDVDIHHNRYNSCSVIWSVRNQLRALEEAPHPAMICHLAPEEREESLAISPSKTWPKKWKMVKLWTSYAAGYDKNQETAVRKAGSQRHSFLIRQLFFKKKKHDVSKQYDEWWRSMGGWTEFKCFLIHIPTIPQHRCAAGSAKTVIGSHGSAGWQR